MRIDLATMTGKTVSEMKKIYERIPRSESELEIIDQFDDKARHFPAAEALAHLPKHITMVKFKGSYIYYYETVYDRAGYDAYSEMSVEHAKIGLALSKYTAFLPNSVHKVAFSFTYLPDHRPRYREYYHIYALVGAMRLLSSHVRELDLSGTDLAESYYDISQLINESPKSLNKIMLRSEDLNARQYVMHHLLNAVQDRVKQLAVTGSYLGRDNQAETLIILGKFSSNLRDLDLSKNELAHKNVTDLSEIFRNLPGELKFLSLASNLFWDMSPADFASALTHLPSSLREIDLSDNDLLLTGEDALSTILLGLPETVTGLRLREGDLGGMTDLQLSTLLSVLPAHIETFSFSSPSLSLGRFITSLSGLPDSVKTLDLSEYRLYALEGRKLAQLFSAIPAHIRKLKLNSNRLVNMPFASLEEGFKNLARTIVEIDISDNDFDALSRIELNKYMRIIPESVMRVVVDEHQFGVRQDGVLIPITSSSLQTHSLLKQPKQGVIGHQKNMRQYQLFMLRCLSVEKMNPDLWFLIMSFLLGDSESEKKIVRRKLTTAMIPSKKPQGEMSIEIQKRSVDLAISRIKALLPGETVLDLSRCGLNRVSNDEMLQALISKLPNHITILKLRGNGFVYQNEHSQGRKIEKSAGALLQKLPKGITCLDLSDNGLEYFDGPQLQQLFAKLPATVTLVTVNHTKPVPPLHLIAQRTWPTVYAKEVAVAGSALRKARMLLDAYTKGGSAWQRFISWHWNRHHCDLIARIVTRIDQGELSNVSDVMEAIEQIPMSNPQGSLMKRLRFIERMALEPETVGVDTEMQAVGLRPVM